MKLCTLCQAQAADEALFCPVCGTQFAQAGAAQYQDMEQSTLLENQGQPFTYTPVPPPYQSQQQQPFYPQPPQYGAQNPYAQQPYPQPPYQPAYNEKYNALAIVGFILGCVAIFTSYIFVFGIIGLILSLIGQQQIKASHEKGLGLAIAGICTSAFSLLIGLMFIAAILSY